MDSALHEQSGEITVLMADFTDRITDFYEHLSDFPVIRLADEKTLERVSRQAIPDAGRPLREVYQEMLRDVYSNTLLAQHPRSFSCIPSTASLLSWIGDVMTNAFNPHDSCRVNAPAIALIEQKLIRWMCDLAGYPAEGGGLFVSGASMANLLRFFPFLIKVELLQAGEIPFAALAPWCILIRAGLTFASHASPRLHFCRSPAQEIIVNPLVSRIPCVLKIFDAGNGLHLPAHFENGSAHILIGHLVHVHGLHYLPDAQINQGILQSVDGVDAADADKECVVRQEAGGVAL